MVWNVERKKGSWADCCIFSRKRRKWWRPLSTWAVEAPGCGRCGRFVGCRSDRDVAATSRYWSETQDTAAERAWEEALEGEREITATVTEHEEARLGIATSQTRDVNRRNRRRCWLCLTFSTWNVDLQLFFPSATFKKLKLNHGAVIIAVAMATSNCMLEHGWLRVH